ncbi:DUF998 domain-containing protein [Jatrophihabitans sp.]|uniref:DUF998 domain-containing protein n=1 Tax=Jatrophihabitans sp. TaxID=1932789 RepID=UPI0030C665DC|nr:integral rane protein [Jatrophihabitans sp.]
MLAPVMLVGGFCLAAARQPGSYDPLRDTISALAARGATDRWIMSLAFVLLGLCHLGTAWGLRRPVLAAGGACTALLALAPQPEHGSSGVHVLLATVALACLALWPLPRDRAAVVALAGLLAWFLVALQLGAAVGLAERCLTVAESLWPIVAVRRSRDRDTASGR